ncbi:MAG: PBP1A family penicillin-binding protein [Gracilibacteraceae bacterium]|jgi:penicillin-binding protein 1A|nr:PBP1A family penicillin-binding protein [Gracilibacteraceae bacterium]
MSAKRPGTTPNSATSAARRKKEKKLARRRRRRVIIRSILLLLLLLIVTVGVFGGLFVYRAASKTPEWNPELLVNQKQSSVVYDSGGAQIAQLHQSENRLAVDFKDVPPLVRETFIAVEDKRFYEHFGADPIRIAKAFLNNLRSGSLSEGGSTITIQLAKMTFIDDPTAKKYERKIQELILALQIERNYTKDEILTFYLNRIFLGENCFGIRTASLTYFGKELAELNPAEVALLAGLPQSPSVYDPYLNPDSAKKRRNLVLSVMVDNGLLTAAEEDRWREEPFTFVEQVKSGEAQVSYSSDSGFQMQKRFPYFVDFVTAQLQDELGFSAEEVFSGGLRIYTTVEPKIQAKAEEMFANAENFPSDSGEFPAQGAITMVDNSSGAVVAMVGGRQYTPMGLNRAWQTVRQPGSSVKPLTVYAPALESGSFFPGSVFDDFPVTYNLPGGSWSPVDYDTETSGWKGLITMREAVRNSVNVYAVRLIEALGIEYCWNFAKNNLGLPLEERHKVLALSLGVAEMSTLDMALAYSVFPNSGFRNKAFAVTRVEDAAGKVLYEQKPAGERVMKETTAYLMNDLLRTVVTSGTGTRAQIANWYICGKTGTSSLDPELYGFRTGNPDAWFIGYSPLYTAAVWMGYDVVYPNHYFYQQYGGNFPARLWKEVMTTALEDKAVQSSIPRPEGITAVSFDLKSGLLPSSLTPDNFIGTEICATDGRPTSVSEVWVERVVDPARPDLLAPEGSGGVTRLFLDLPWREEEAETPWPPSEAAYRIPTEYSQTMDTGERPQTGDASIPTPVIADPMASVYEATVTMRVDSEFDESLYGLVLYVRDPNGLLLSYIPDDVSAGVITYRFAEPGTLLPGTYTFWAAYVDKESFAVGPASQSYTLEVAEE